jgi:DNA-binding transcriptional ArsR family regulator
MNRLNLNKILASSCRQKILKALSEKRGITIMKLVSIVNSTYNEVDRNVRILEREYIVTQRYDGRKRVIRLNFKNEKTLVLLKLLMIREGALDLEQLRRNLLRALENTKEKNKIAKH